MLEVISEKLEVARQVVGMNMVARPPAPLCLLPSRVGPPGAWSSILGRGRDPVRLAGGESPVLVDVAEHQVEVEGLADVVAELWGEVCLRKVKMQIWL